MRTDTLTVAFAIFLVGLATILGAWAFQIFGGLMPCPLCLEQRWPYYIGLPLVFLSLLATWFDGPRWLSRGALALGGIVFLYGAYLGLYHAGAEWAWWEGPTDCAPGGATLPTTSGDLQTQLENMPPIVPCTVAAWRFPNTDWGLSLAGFNAIIATVLGVAAIVTAARKPDPI